ncbi:MAG: hypothetical protein ACLFTW_15560 [Chitinispirillaceae bacterium]
MKYVKPEQVTSPQEYLSDISVVYDGGEKSFSIARINWDGTGQFAIRWNVARREWDDPSKQSEAKECVGMPSSRGYPVWFVLPDELMDKDSDVWEKIREFKKTHI